MKTKTWIYILILLLVIYLAIFSYNRIQNRSIHEGFQQSDPYVVKRNAEIYDEFYVDIYDKLNMPEKRVPFEVDAIVANTQASPKSAILEIGSGTGYLVNSLKTRGYDVYGIDLSKPMVDYSEKKYTDISIKCGDVEDPITFEKGTFSHILCLHFTIYQFQDKVAFFRNCYHWLMNNSYLVLHLVDREKYDAIVPAGKPDTRINIQSYTKDRITNTEIDFGDFQYTANVDFSKTADDTVVISEKFTDKLTKRVRQNEQTLYMEPIAKILQMARYCGFLLQGKMEYTECNGDAHQYLYFLEKPM